jgi:phage tail sheath protein FI
MRHPGVFDVEKNAFPNSVVPVATAVPAFIGYTDIASNEGTSLLNVPWKIGSMAEFQSYFGGPPPATFHVTRKAATATPSPPAGTLAAKFSFADYDVTREEQSGSQFLLYYSMLLFFQSGGGPCYIVSVGPHKGSTVDPQHFIDGINLLLKEQEPTMIVIPDAVRMDQPNWAKVSTYALAHCGKEQSRIAILDVYDGYKNRQDPAGDVVAKFRDAVGVNFLNYGAAYYPWLNTSILADSDVGFLNIDNRNLKDLLTAEGLAPQSNLDEIDKLKDYQTQLDAALDFDPNAPPNSNDKARLAARLNLLNSALPAVSSAYVKLTTEIKQQLNLLPPAAAMAGVYTMVDNTWGVWKAPANVSLNAVVSPAVNISSDDQEDLNVSPTGTSINAVRSFIGEGVLVWGARTLDGNSLDWRYICVRRTMIFLEQSIKLATKAYVFDSNASTTWVTIKSMIRNFLTGIWQQGGLAGASPDNAFAVFCGLGETMTAQDILDGILRVTVMVAVTRPAEFIEITFQQQMQKS